MARPSAPLLSPEIIGDAGLALARAGKPFGVNAIARHLGVRPSSLYNHVDGMDEIVELMRGRLVQSYRVHPGGGSWDEVVLAVLRSHRRMYADHPLLVPLLVGKTITHPGVIAAYDDLATVLVDAGFPESEILTVIAVIDAFAIGFGLDLASPDDVWQPSEETRTLGRVLHGAAGGAERADRTFELGSAILLDSLRARLAAGA
ncbi:TetR/AcrR family transcriptional regulator C-terminal domain-containing protein [Microbacterium oryzae]|uniref:TetR/AcrR family transcriptional regulator C-terminal domain-containing protein n=1 Tax=Microbacterium oryzae TaxID=743009 RepID=UPI0025B235F5|nr:TetR/AcrR family transcriptional regulator C-terminal domain-containing protein [Microbacterium oryzae]MDN3311121.1 TetR/AcrR family transcriptional regulator C-terminal domain-containing protein [Microbacterium oryzae]